MNTRRVFLKTLLGLGAIALPWSLWPIRVDDAIKHGLGRPSVNLLLPPESNGYYEIDGVDAECLNRTAMDDILTLTGDEMQGRKAGSVGEAKAAQYLEGQLRKLGLMPMGDQKTTFMHVFTIPPVIETKTNGRLTFRPGDSRALKIPAVNLLGGLMGETTEEVILLSAHYDHMGIFDGRAYPGANDNASGVGCILDVMRRVLREEEVPKRTIVIAFWSAEEMGFIGSQAFVRAPSFPIQQIKAVLNVDTIGNGKKGNFMLWANAHNIAVKALRQAATECGASASLTASAGHNSDSVSFATVNVPAVTLVSKEWLVNNHTPEDDVTQLNVEQVQLATEVIYRAVRTLAF